MDKFKQTIFRFIKEWSLIAPGDRVLSRLFGWGRFSGAFTFHGFKSRQNGD